jgi:RHS repeat-associated protein
VSQQRYMPFGEARTDVGAITQTDFGYTGQRNLDAQGNSFSTGLMDYKARFYDVALARFISPDTITPGGPQGLNRYSYSLNNPINFNDPTGHCVGPDGHDFPDGSLACNVGNNEENDPLPSTNICEINPALPGCASEADYPPIFYRDLTEEQLIDYFQSQGGDKTGCGPYAIAMASNLYKGKNIYQGADVEKSIEHAGLKFPGYGMPTSLPFDDSLKYYSGGREGFTAKDATIGDIEHALENNELPIVAVSWQTDFQIISDINNATVGHWMVVVGFSPQTDQLYFLNSGLSQEEGSKSLWSYSYQEFNQYWKNQPNIFILPGNLRTIYP